MDRPDLWIGPGWRRDKDPSALARNACKETVRDANSANRAAVLRFLCRTPLPLYLVAPKPGPHNLAYIGDPGQRNFYVFDMVFPVDRAALFRTAGRADSAAISEAKCGKPCG